MTDRKKQWIWRVTKFCRRQIGQPVDVARKEMEHLYHGETIGGGQAVARLAYDEQSEVAKFTFINPIFGMIEISVSA